MKKATWSADDPATEGGKFCGAKLRRPRDNARKTCRKPAGYNTDHLGTGRCHLHAGRTPVKHGRFSTLNSVRLRELIAQFERDPDPLNIFPELAAARALFVDYIERYQLNSAALIAWYEARKNGKPAPRPVRILDIADAHRLLEGVGKMAERIEKMRMMDAISRGELVRVVQEIARVVERFNNIPDGEERLRLIRQEWRSIPAQIGRTH